MYKYINLFSISIFLLVHTYYMQIGQLKEIKEKYNDIDDFDNYSLYQFKIIIKGSDINLLEYNSQMLMILLILKVKFI